MQKRKTKSITIYQSPNRREQADKPYGFNKIYHIPNGDVKQLEKAVAWDNCLVQYKDGYRKTDNYIQANCMLADIDNTHSDNEADWVTHEDVIKALPDVVFYYYPSRNHMKSKDGKTPRPKVHMIFPTDILETASEYSDVAKKLVSMFPQLHFDAAVTGAAQLNFGVENPIVSYVDGSLNLTDYILSIEQKKPKQTPDIHTSYLQETQKCYPLLEEKEIQMIWNGAVNYYNSTIKKQADYIEPAVYHQTPALFQWEIPPVNPTAVQQLYSIEKKNRKFSIAVAKLILKAIGVTIKINDMNGQTEVYGIPEKYGKDDLNNLLVTFISDIAYQLSYKRVTSNVVQETLHVIARENHYHPVLSLLYEKSWDHTDRLQTIYDILGLSDNRYQSLVKKWAIQTIAVLFNSSDMSVAAEGVLVLQGKQGIGKTQFFRHLAIRDSFFKGGATLDMTNKDSLMSATKVWICELGEIDSTTKKEQSALKAFLTEKTDRYREPYARYETIRPRRTSFCGTVNPKDYLRDETGNRRFWTIPIEKIDIKKIFKLSSEWYVQFWRQVLDIYKANPNGYLLTEEEQDFINLSNRESEQQLFGEDEFMTCADFQADKKLWKLLSAAEIANLLNKQFKSLHISSVKVGKLLGRIEKRTNIVFERKIVRGKRLILCPPMVSTDDVSLTSDLPDYEFSTLRTIYHTELVEF